MAALDTPRRRASLTDAQLLELAQERGIDRAAARRARSRTRRPRTTRRSTTNERRAARSAFTATHAERAVQRQRPPHDSRRSVSEPSSSASTRPRRTRADDLLDRGADPRDARARRSSEARAEPARSSSCRPARPTTTSTTIPAQPPLATPPLDLAGLPSFGAARRADDDRRCCAVPSSHELLPRALRAARQLAGRLPRSRARRVGAVLRRHAATMPASSACSRDAALCAEQRRRSSVTDFDSPSSPGWRWVEAMLGETSCRRRRIADRRS